MRIPWFGINICFLERLLGMMGVHQVPRLLVKNHFADPQCLVEEIGRQASFHFL
jgi:hypothetical protein